MSILKSFTSPWFCTFRVQSYASSRVFYEYRMGCLTYVIPLRLVLLCYNKPITFLDRLCWIILVARRAGGYTFWWSMCFLTKKICQHHNWKLRYFWRSKHAFEFKFLNSLTQISLFPSSRISFLPNLGSLWHRRTCKIENSICSQAFLTIKVKIWTSSLASSALQLWKMTNSLYALKVFILNI